MAHLAEARHVAEYAMPDWRVLSATVVLVLPLLLLATSLAGLGASGSASILPPAFSMAARAPLVAREALERHGLLDLARQHNLRACG